MDWPDPAIDDDAVTLAYGKAETDFGWIEPGNTKVVERWHARDDEENPPEVYFHGPIVGERLARARRQAERRAIEEQERQRWRDTASHPRTPYERALYLSSLLRMRLSQHRLWLEMSRRKDAPPPRTIVEGKLPSYPPYVPMDKLIAAARKNEADTPDHVVLHIGDSIPPLTLSWKQWRWLVGESDLRGTNPITLARRMRA